MKSLPKKGMIVTTAGGHKVKVLEVLGSLVFLSCKDDHNASGSILTLDDLLKGGCTWDEDKWEPKHDERYYFIESDGAIESIKWDGDKFDLGRRDFMGVYPTEEAAQSALAEIKRKLNSSHGSE